MLNKKQKPEIVVEIHYKENGKRIDELLKQSILFYLENEVKKQCNLQS